MRKMLACFLALLMCCTGLTAFAESLTLPEVLPKSYFLELPNRIIRIGRFAEHRTTFLGAMRANRHGI